MASILKVDDLRGKTAAGDITITSEGGSATMQLQQGIAKCWVCYDGEGTPAIDDSLNSSSLTDVTTARQTVTYTNNMSSAHYSITASAVGNDSYYGVVTSDTIPSTSSAMHPHTRHLTNTAYDMDRVSVTNHGDLA
jgi:hypothetical protein